MLTASNTQQRFIEYWHLGDTCHANPPTGHRPVERSASRRPALPIAGLEAIDLVPEQMAGAWSLRFGRFGCPDHETRGGVVQLFDDAFIGGDQNFAYRGQWRVEGSELNASIEVVRHGEAAGTPTIFGAGEQGYSAAFVAEAITPDLFEGRIRRTGHPDIRVVVRRLPFGRA